MSKVTLQVGEPAPKKVVQAWQKDLLEQFERWGWDHPLKVDGVYGVDTRAATAQALYGLGISRREMREGVTPELRSKVRNRELTKEERAKRDSAERKAWRKEQKAKYGRKVFPMFREVLADSWDYHPGVHDGIDVITPENEPVYAPVRCRVLRISDDWWGKGAPSDESTRDKGDGLVVLEVLETHGPLKKGLRIGLGHAEKPVVKVGQEVKAGQRVCRAGLANAWHIHLMVWMRPDDRGMGDRDPEPAYRFAQAGGRR
jgi:murein DD-endopeptidase MepM/ murein hydrolase activator NlpD